MTVAFSSLRVGIDVGFLDVFRCTNAKILYLKLLVQLFHLLLAVFLVHTFPFGIKIINILLFELKLYVQIEGFLVYPSLILLHHHHHSDIQAQKGGVSMGILLKHRGMRGQQISRIVPKMPV